MRVEPKTSSRNHQKVLPNHQKVIPEPRKCHPETNERSPRNHAKVIPGIRVRCSETLWKCERDAQDRPVGAGRTKKIIPKPSKSHPKPSKSHPETNKKHPETNEKSTRNHTKVIPAIRVRCSETLCKCERDAQDRPVSASSTKESHPETIKQ